MNESKRRVTYQALVAIREKHGELTPDVVVEEARDPEHPLHGRFTWDDTEAAACWRIHQADRLIRKVKVHREDTTKPTRNVTVVREQPRAFIAGAEFGGRPNTYEPIEEVMSDPEKRARFLLSLKVRWTTLRAMARGYEEEFRDMVLSDLEENAS